MWKFWLLIFWNIFFSGDWFDFAGCIPDGTVWPAWTSKYCSCHAYNGRSYNYHHTCCRLNHEEISWIVISCLSLKTTDFTNLQISIHQLWQFQDWGILHKTFSLTIGSWPVPFNPCNLRIKCLDLSPRRSTWKTLDCKFQK